MSTFSSGGDFKKNIKQALDGIISADNGVEVKKGELVTLDLGEPKKISEVTLYTDIGTPGQETKDVKITVGKNPDLSDGVVVFNGTLESGPKGTTIAFPETKGQYIGITGGTSANGSTVVNEVVATNPSLSPTPTPSRTPTPTITPSPTPTPLPLSQASATPLPTPPPPTSTPVPNPLVATPTPTPVNLNVLVTSNSAWGSSQTMLAKLVNSVISVDDYAQVEAGKYMQINLPSPTLITKIQVYPQPLPNRIVKSLKVEVSSSPSFGGSQQLFFSDVLANVNGIIIAPNPPVTAQYIRITANGTEENGILDPVNKFSEVAIWAN